MAGSQRIPGTLCVSTHPRIDAGTLCLHRSTPPGPVGGGRHGAAHKRTPGHGARTSPRMTASAVRAAVNRARVDAIKLLKRRRDDIKAWSQETEHHFAAWFGNTDTDARTLVLKRIEQVLAKLEHLSPHDFIIMKEPDPRRMSSEEFEAEHDFYDGLFAYVLPGWTERGKFESTVYIGPEFGPAGALTRAGTLIHEVSHFKSAGETHDVEGTYTGDVRAPGKDRKMYGYDNAIRLAGQNSADALRSAENFEFFIERHDPAVHSPHLTGVGDFPISTQRSG